MTAKMILLSAAMAALAATAWFAWPRLEPAPVATRAASAGVSPATAELPAQHLGTAAASEQALERRAIDAGPAATTESLAANEPGPRVQVRVLDQDGTAMPGLTVRYLLPQELDNGMDAAARDELKRLALDGEALLQRFGRAAVTDADGIARWPWCESDRHWWQVGARHEQYWGEVRIRTQAAADEVHELRLGPDRALTIRVLDAQQQPAPAMTLAASYQRAGAGVDQELSGYQEIAVTDADGNAVARHLQTWSQYVEPRGTVRPILLRPCLPGIDVGHEVDADSPPAEPVVLYLPPTGVVEVELLDGLGQPLTKGSRVILEPEPRDADGRHAWAALAEAPGRCRFPFVGLGQQWRVTLQGEQRLEQVFTGPRSSGEVARVRLQPGAMPVLTGTLLFAGRPAAKVAVQWTTPRGPLSRQPTVTDTDGRFRVVADTGTWLGQDLQQLTCSGVDARGQPDGRLAKWTGDLRLDGGERDLGTLTLTAIPLLVSGRMVAARGDLGAPLPAVWVEASTGDPEQPWDSLPLTRRVQPDGTFEFRGEPPAAALRLRVDSACHYLPLTPLSFAAGAQDVVVTLRQGGSLKASVIANSPELAFCLAPLLVPLQPVEATSGGYFVRYTKGRDPMVPAKDAFVREEPLEVGYEWPALPPGRYRLLVRTRCVPTVLLQIDDLVVADGECNQDARLQHLQVPTLKFLKLQLPQAKPILAEAQQRRSAQGAGVMFVLDGDQPTDQCMQIDGMVFFAASRPLDLLVRLRGYRDRVLRGVFEDQTVELEPGIAVAVTCAGLPADAQLQCTLVPLEDPLSAAHSWICSLAAGGGLPIPIYTAPAVTSAFAAGRAEFALCAPGRYRLSAQLVGADGKTRPVAIAPAQLSIDETGGSFAVQVQLSK